MSKKVWQQLVDQNMVTITELREVTDKMESLAHTNRFTEWNELNQQKAALIDDLALELSEAYHAQPVTSVRLQAYDSFWNKVNQIVNGGKR